MSEHQNTPTFGIVAEGAADHTVLRLLLAGYFGDSDIVTRPLQPVRDETGTFESGGWAQVLEYCASAQFRSAFDYTDFIVIQIDTDVSDKHPSYGISHHDSAGPLSCEKLVEAVCDKLISTIGLDFYQKQKDKILFAVCVHSIECWILPLYFTDGRREKIVNCLGSLNEKLIEKHRFSIDAKSTHYYLKAAKDFSKTKALKAHWHQNPSLKIFVGHLEQRFGRGFVLSETP